MQDFLKAIQDSNFKPISTETLENISEQYPYFHLGKSILLKKYHVKEHFKYNSFLKNIAAHTIDRELLFEYINSPQTHPDSENTSKDKIETAQTNSLLVSAEESTISKIDFQKPLNFKNEKHSFHEWLQLKNKKPIQRIPAVKTTDSTPVEKENTQDQLDNKLNIINKFIENNPKISPLKKITTENTILKESNNTISEELMTETLAKVYFIQKKYDKAIQAYKILSLKYPEKSSLFADQIHRIKIIQTHK